MIRHVVSDVAQAASLVATLHLGIVNTALAEPMSMNDAAGTANSSMFKPDVSDLYTEDDGYIDFEGFEFGADPKGMSTSDLYSGVAGYSTGANDLPDVDDYEELYDERDTRIDRLSDGAGEFDASGRGVEREAYRVLEGSQGVESLRGQPFLAQSTSILTERDVAEEFSDCIVPKVTGTQTYTYDDYLTQTCARTSIDVKPFTATRVSTSPSFPQPLYKRDGDGGNTRCEAAGRTVDVKDPLACLRMGAFSGLPSTIEYARTCAPDRPGATACVAFRFKGFDAVKGLAKFKARSGIDVIDVDAISFAYLVFQFADTTTSSSSWSYDHAAYAEMKSLVDAGYCTMSVKTLETGTTCRPSLAGGLSAADEAAINDRNQTRIRLNGSLCGLSSVPGPFTTAPLDATKIEIRASCTAGGNYKTTNTCTPYEGNPKCDRVEQRCVANRGGKCLTYAEEWSCGETRTYETPVVEEVNICSGSLFCEGGDCFPSSATGGAQSFAETAARLSAAEMMAADMTCTPATSSEIDPGSCSVFNGKRQTCGMVVLGLSNCCDVPEGVSVVDYIQLAFAVSRLNSVFMDAGKANLLTSTWGTLETTARNSFSAMTRPLTESWDSIIGNSAATKNVAPEAAKGMLGAAKQQMMQTTAKWVGEVFGEQAANAIFAGAKGGPAMTNGVVAETIGLNATAQTILSTVATAYSVYVITSMLIDILLACSDNELKLGVSKAIKATHKVGTYCDDEFLGMCLQEKTSYCEFSSPLSRIMNEEIRKQTGRGWGSAEKPDCKGFTVEELQDVDFDALDLSEWTGMLSQAGMIDPSGLSPETLTGEESALGVGLADLYEREDAVERSQNKFGGINTDTIRRDGGYDFGKSVTTD